MSRSKRRPPTKSGKRVYPRTRTINWRWSTPTQREVEKVHVSRYLGTLNSWEIMREHCGENLRKKIALKLPNWQLADSQKDSSQTNYGRKRPSTSICGTPGGAVGGGAESKDHHYSALLPPARLPQPMLLALTPSLLHGIESNRINFSFTTNPCRGVSALLLQWCSILLADLDFVHAVKM